MTASGATSGRQLVLDLAHEPSFAADAFLTSNSNAHARAMVERWPDWPERMLLLVGPAGSGKSHLGAIWAARSTARRSAMTIIRPGALLDPGAILAGASQDNPAVLLEDCDRADHSETALFHLMNLVRERRGWLLVTARAHPDTWGLETPDVLSRLRLAPVVHIEAPDAALIRAVLVKLFRDRQIRIDHDVIAYATLHSEQSLEAISRFVSAIDEDALAEGRRITRPLAIRTLTRLNECNQG